MDAIRRGMMGKHTLKGLCNDFSTCHISVVFCCLNNTSQSSEFFSFGKLSQKVILECFLYSPEFVSSLEWRNIVNDGSKQI